MAAVLVIIPMTVITFFDNLWHRRAQAVRQGIVSACVLVVTLPLAPYFLPRQLPRETSGIGIDKLISLITDVMRLLRAVSDTLLFQLNLYPYSPLPNWPGQIVILSTLVLRSALFLVKSTSQGVRLIFQWFVYVFIFYLFAVGAGVYAYGNFGYRYSLIIAPLFVLVLSATIEQLVQRKQLFFATALLPAVLSIASVQNAVGSRAWPETRKDSRSVAICWEQHRNESDPTYVYYGAAPGFAYYKQVRALEISQCLLWGVVSLPNDRREAVVESARDPRRRRRDVSGLFFHTYISVTTRHFSPGFPSNTVVDPICRSLGASAYLLQRH